MRAARSGCWSDLLSPVLIFRTYFLAIIAGPPLALDPRAIAQLEADALFLIFGGFALAGGLGFASRS